MNIAGSGFSGYLDASDSGTKVEAWVTYRVGGKKKGTDVTEYLTADISSWSDTEIVGSFPACPDDTVDVTTVFDTASASVIGGGGGGSCADYTDEASCTADASCRWNSKKSLCKDARGGGKNK